MTKFNKYETEEEKIKLYIEKYKEPFWFIVRTNKERRENYNKLISLGYNTKTAYRLRDWRKSKLKPFLKERKDLIPTLQ